MDRLGPECLLYSSDYPHGDMSWTRVPETRADVRLSDAEKAALLGGNAARFYKLPAAGGARGGAAATARPVS